MNARIAATCERPRLNRSRSPCLQSVVFARTLSIGGFVGCADDSSGTTSTESTSATEAQTTEVAGTGASTGTTGSTDEDALAPWYGSWYAVDPLFVLNIPEYWGNGGESLAITTFELSANSATIYNKSCLWGWSLRFDYTTVMGENGVVDLEPVGGVHEFKPHGEISRIYLRPGSDCSSLTVVEVNPEGEEFDLFARSGAPLARGKLCLEKCAMAQGDYGIITDCGTPVPWDCDE